MADEEDVEYEEDQVQAPTAVEEEEEVAKEDISPLAPPKYEVRPDLGDKFQAANVREIMSQCMREQLMGRAYRADQVQRWCKAIANGVRHRVQALDMKRYKIAVSTTIIEMKGAGVKCAMRCIWDPETDDYADNSYRNDTIYCYSVCFGIYMY